MGPGAHLKAAPPTPTGSNRLQFCVRVHQQGLHLVWSCVSRFQRHPGAVYVASACPHAPCAPVTYQVSIRGLNSLTLPKETVNTLSESSHLLKLPEKPSTSLLDHHSPALTPVSGSVTPADAKKSDEFMFHHNSSTVHHADTSATNASPTARSIAPANGRARAGDTPEGPLSCRTVSPRPQGTRITGCVGSRCAMRRRFSTAERGSTHPSAAWHSRPYGRLLGRGSVALRHG
jgi:hypothetical protein